MRIVIKAIKRNELTLEVDPTTTIKEAKILVEGLTQIPWTHQKLLLLGRNLKDESTFSYYPTIVNGTKLILVETREIRQNLPDILQRKFRKYFNDYQSKQLTNRFMAHLLLDLKHMSLDDLERLAANL